MRTEIACHSNIGESGIHSRWLVGWLELISVRRMGIKSTILPPEGHIGRAKLWIYSIATLP
jgi:hypothetical protein